MKNLEIIIITLALATLSFTSMAATAVDSAPSEQLKIGVISACTESNNLTSLQNELVAKAAEMGASSYRITAASGNNHLCGSAEIYK
ncbi:multiple stress resistance protein BhsA [Serratia aquatilis]|uniref:DUF1471 domain-containing protein n=1 Tax=Serratia aquatilis TaxID=1737515 RepID=A0ABV6E904_9GAMM